jgi:hypothetical protein
MTWEPGYPVVVRAVREGEVRGLRAHTIAADRPDLIALYIGPGYPRKMRTGLRGGPRDRILIRDDGGFIDAPWVDNGALVLHRPGDAHSTYLFWADAAAEPSVWYIDLHEPLRRTPIGFDTQDHVLDAIVALDRRTWYWKDEDELAWHRSAGLLALPPEEVLRAEGLRAVERLTQSDPPLYAEWERWQPDPAWRVPTIPPRWREVFSD